jgi:hypothetical protein
LRGINVAFEPKKKDDETKGYTPLTDPSFRKAALSPMTIEERRKWEVMFTRFHQPHSELVSAFDGFKLPPGGEAGDFLTTDGHDKYYWSNGACYWKASGANIYFATGNIAVGDVPNDTNTIYAKGNILVQSDTAQPYVKISNASDTARDPVLQFAVGATPAVKYTMGVDDSDSDKHKVAFDSGFGPTNDALILYGGSGSGSGISEFTLLDSWPNTLIQNYAYGLCSDDIYFYYSGLSPQILAKVDLTTDTEILNVGSMPYITMLATDKTHLYAICPQEYLVRKYNCSDLSIDTTGGSYGSTYSIRGFCYYSGHLYLAVNVTFGGGNQIIKVDCLALGTDWSVISQQERATDK